MTSSVQGRIEDWVQRQGRVFAGRRRFIRGFLIRTLVYGLVWRVQGLGLEHVPPSGGALLAMNHSTVPDPLLPLGMVDRFIIPITKVENYLHPFYGLFVKSWGALTVQRGQVDRRAIEASVRLLGAGELVLNFIEGTRSPALIRGRVGTAHIALQANALIVPTAVYGLDGWGYDFVRPWRWKRLQPTVAFGPPFRLKPPAGFDGERLPRETLRAMTDAIMVEIARLLPEHKRGYYRDLAQVGDYLEFQ